MLDFSEQVGWLHPPVTLDRKDQAERLSLFCIDLKKHRPVSFKIELKGGFLSEESRYSLPADF